MFIFQGRVPWNLAGLVGHLGPDPGSGLSHYSPHYPPPNSGGGHNPHLLGHPGSSHEQSSLWAMGMHPGLGPPGSGEGSTDPIGLSYKSLADPMSMYYASQVRLYFVLYATKFQPVKNNKNRSINFLSQTLISLYKLYIDRLTYFPNGQPNRFP